MKSRKLVIVGAGTIAQLANYYFEMDSEYEVVGFTVDREFCNGETYENKPLFPIDELDKKYINTDIELFIAFSYTNMNKERANKYNSLKAKGYRFASYVSTKCTFLSQYPPGENVFILENNTVQPFVKIEDNVTLWSGNHIGHHSVIHSHNFISSHVVISGFCAINSYCFIGVNAAIAHNVTLAEGTLVGIGAVIVKDTEEDSVYTSAKSVKLDKPSNYFKL